MNSYVYKEARLSPAVSNRALASTRRSAGIITDAFLCRIDDATIRWREPNELPEGSPRPDIPGRKKDRKAVSTWRDLVVELGTDERLLDQVHQERRPK